MDGDDKPGDPLAARGDEIALGHGEGIAAAIREAYREAFREEREARERWLDHLITCPDEGRALRPDLGPAPARQFRDALSALSLIASPAERAVHGHELQKAIKGSTARLRAIVDESVAELRETMSLAQVAGMLGVSVQRVSQIATGKHRAARQAE